MNMPNRSVRASLVFLNTLLYQLATSIISLVITPLIVASLGVEVFGAWKVIEKTTTFLSLGNFKPFLLLPLILAKDISNNDHTYKQQQIGAAISIVILTLPIIIILSSLLFYFRDVFIPVSKQISHQIDLTLLVMIFYTIIMPFLYAPSVIISGLNMQYKLFGINSIAMVISALLQYGIVVYGYTLPWIAAISSFVPILTSAVISYIIIVKYIPWLRLVRPPLLLIRSFFKNNLWVLSTETFRYMYRLSDLIFIGIYFDVTTAAIYSLTKTLVIFLFTPVNSLARSALAGIGDLVGRKEIKGLIQLRSEQINVVIFMGFIIGVIVMYFNASFVGLWVDGKHFGGQILSEWFIAAAIIDALVKNEANYLDASLSFKRQTLSLGTAAIVYVAIIILWVPVLRLNVFPIAQVVSQIVLIALYWIGLRDCLQSKVTNLAKTVLRPLCIAAILFNISLWVKLPVIHNWMELFIQASGVATLTGILGWFLILKKNDRNKLRTRLSNIFMRFSER